MDFVRLHIFKFVVDWTRFEVWLAHTMASPVPAVDVEVGGTADVMAHDCGDSSGAGAEGARAGHKRQRAPKCKPGEDISNSAPHVKHVKTHVIRVFGPDDL